MEMKTLSAGEKSVIKATMSALLADQTNPKDFQQIRTKFSEILKTNFENRNVWLRFGLTISLSEDSPHSALQAYNECMRIDQDDPLPAMLAAKLSLEYLNDPQRGLDLIEEAIKRCNKDIDVVSTLLSRCYLLASIMHAHIYESEPESIKKFKLENLRASLRFLDLATETNPNDHLIYFHKALHQVKQRTYPMAIDNLRKALKLSPHHLPTMQLLILSLSAMKFYNEALLLCESTLHEHEDNLLLLYIKCNLEQSLVESKGYKTALNTALYMLRCLRRVRSVNDNHYNTNKTHSSTTTISAATQSLQQQQQQQQQQQSQTQSQNDPYTNATHAILLDLRQQLITRAMKFDGHFRNLLSQSKLSLHSMFVATYGMMYEHNTEIFTNMYESLEQYYTTGRIRLTKSMENFFHRLYQKIFQVANSNRIFSPNYLDCVAQQLTIFKPFKDAPDKLIVDIRHALVAARAMYQALNEAIDIIKNIISLGDPPQCIKLINEKLLRNQQPTLGGTTRELKINSGTGTGANLPPCQHFCEQVIVRCVGRSNLEPLAEHWRTYVVALAELAKKLSVQYNIETIIGPIDVQISEAIMNFQENSQNITERVYAMCGDARQNNGGYQSPLSNVAPLRAPAHNSLGKRETPLAMPKSIAVSAAGSQSSLGNYRQQASQQSLASSSNNNRRHLQPTTGLRLAVGAAQSLAMPNHPGDYEQAMMLPPRVFAPSASSAANNHQLMMTEQHRSRSNGIHGHGGGVGGPSSSSMAQFESYDDVPNSPLAPINRKPPTIIREIQDYLLSLKNFWSNLPNSVCNITQWANNSSSSSSTYHPRRNSQQHCFQEPLEVSDVNSDFRYRQEIQNQIQRLESMHSKISDALLGIEIDWSKDSTPTTGSSSLPMDYHHLQQPQSQPSTQTQTNLGPVQRLPPQQQQIPGGYPEDEEPEEEPLIEPGSGGDEPGEYPDTPPDDGDYTEVGDDDSTENEDTTTTTAPTDPTSEIPNTEVETKIETGGKLENDLITVVPSGRSRAGSSFFVIDRMSLLILSITYCALSIILNQTRPLTLH